MSRPTDFPPIASLPTKVGKAAQTFTDRHNEAVQARQARHELELTGRQIAEDADRDAAVAAIEAGHAMPEPTAVPAFEEALAEAIRRETAFATVADRAEAVLKEELVKARDGWLKDAEKQVVAAMSEARAAIAKVDAAQAELRDAIAIRRYAENIENIGTASERPWRAPAQLYSTLKSSGGTPMAVPAVIAELKRSVDQIENPPKPVERERGKLPAGADVVTERVNAGI